MRTEDKELLLTDLCARLPYGVEADCVGEYIKIKYIDPHRSTAYISNLGKTKWESIEVITPYLRPMSSMTDEERKEYEDFIIHKEHINAQGQEWDIDCFSFEGASRLIDWLNKHHFDYRGLIPKGLALEAPEGMYN